MILNQVAWMTYNLKKIVIFLILRMCNHTQAFAMTFQIYLNNNVLFFQNNYRYLLFFFWMNLSNLAVWCKQKEKK